MHLSRPGYAWLRGLRLRKLRRAPDMLRIPYPGDDLEVAVRMLDDGAAAFHPVAAIDVAHALEVADRRVVDVAADHAGGGVALRLDRQRLLERADVVDGVLHLALEPLRQRPVGQAELAANAVERGVEDEREPVGVVAEQREPARMPHHEVEVVAV